MINATGGSDKDYAGMALFPTMKVGKTLTKRGKK
jgi:hypothetical protein